MKKYIPIFLAASMVLSLAGCGAGGSANSAAQSGAVSEEDSVTDTAATEAAVTEAAVTEAETGFDSEVKSDSEVSGSEEAGSEISASEVSGLNSSQTGTGSDSSSGDTTSGQVGSDIVSIQDPSRGLFVDISGYSYEFPLAKADFENDEICLGKDINNDGELYSFKYKGVTFPDLLVECDEDEVTGLRIGYNAVYANSDAVPAAAGDSAVSAAIPVFTVDGLMLGQDFTDEMRDEMEELGYEYLDIPVGVLDDGTEFTGSLTYEASDETGSTYIDVYVNDTEIVGFYVQGLIWD